VNLLTSFLRQIYLFHLHENLLNIFNILNISNLLNIHEKNSFAEESKNLDGDRSENNFVGSSK